MMENLSFIDYIVIIACYLGMYKIIYMNIVLTYFDRLMIEAESTYSDNKLRSKLEDLQREYKKDKISLIVTALFWPATLPLYFIWNFVEEFMNVMYLLFSGKPRNTPHYFEREI